MTIIGQSETGLSAGQVPDGNVHETADADQLAMNANVVQVADGAAFFLKRRSLARLQVPKRNGAVAPAGSQPAVLVREQQPTHSVVGAVEPRQLFAAGDVE